MEIPLFRPRQSAVSLAYRQSPKTRKSIRMSPSFIRGRKTVCTSASLCPSFFYIPQPFYRPIRPPKPIQRKGLKSSRLRFSSPPFSRIKGRLLRQPSTRVSSRTVSVAVFRKSFLFATHTSKILLPLLPLSATVTPFDNVVLK